jgi:hypothetical protein
MKLRDHYTEDFATGVDPVTGRPYTWCDRLLFKEELHGRALLRIQLVDVEKPSTFEKFLVAMFGATFKAAWGLLTGGISNVILGAVAETAAAAHLESIKEEERVFVIGEAEVTLQDVDELPRQLQLELTVPERVLRHRLVYDQDTGKYVRTGEMLLQKGVVNGTVQITLRDVAVHPVVA